MQTDKLTGSLRLLSGLSRNGRAEKLWVTFFLFAPLRLCSYGIFVSRCKSHKFPRDSTDVSTCERNPTPAVKSPLSMLAARLSTFGTAGRFLAPLSPPPPPPPPLPRRCFCLLSLLQSFPSTSGPATFLPSAISRCCSCAYTFSWAWGGGESALDSNPPFALTSARNLLSSIHRQQDYACSGRILLLMHST